MQCKVDNFVTLGKGNAKFIHQCWKVQNVNNLFVFISKQSWQVPYQYAVCNIPYKSCDAAVLPRIPIEVIFSLQHGFLGFSSFLGSLSCVRVKIKKWMMKYIPIFLSLTQNLNSKC